MRRWIWVAIALAKVIVMSQLAMAHHHPRPLPSPWTDRRPVVKIKKRGHRQLRPHFYWQSPSYLETAPVVFPGPAPTLTPLFAPAKPAPARP